MCITFWTVHGTIQGVISTMHFIMYTLSFPRFEEAQKLEEQELAGTDGSVTEAYKLITQLLKVG